MENYHFLLEDLGFKPIDSPPHFPQKGSSYYMESDEGQFYYWIYEGDHFLLNIHDFFLQEEKVFQFDPKPTFGSYLSLSVIKEASGDLLEPKRCLDCNTILSYFHNYQTFRGILHQNSRYMSVGIEYKNGYLDRFFSKEYNISFEEVAKAFQMVNTSTNKVLYELTDKILNYQEHSPASDFYYEIIAKSILSEVLKDYYNRKDNPIPKDDMSALVLVANTIEEHYMADLPLDFLAKVAMMSKSKLKNIFKKAYGMTITEYTQRKRIDVAKHLLLHTDLSIGHIAQVVGYRSHGRFSSLFKKYAGVLPQEFKRRREYKSPRNE